MAKITIKQIAEKAGVSVGTVDRVLHNRGEVAKETKEKVLKIAKEGNYSTNVFARSLKLNQSLRIAVILPDDNEYWRTQNEGINLAATQYQNLGIIVERYTFDRHNKDSFLNQSTIAIDSKPQGVILAPLLPLETLGICEALRIKNIPFVFVDSNLSGTSPLAFIGQDSRQGGILAAKLLNLGFENGQRALILRFTDFDSLNKTLDERITGFKEFYLQKGFDEKLIEEVIIDKDVEEIHPVLNYHYQRNESIHLFIPNSRAHQVAHQVMANGNKHLSRIVGYDLIEENISCLNNELIEFIIHQNPKVQGRLAVETLYKKLILNTEIESKQLMQLDIITKENLMYGL